VPALPVALKILWTVMAAAPLLIALDSKIGTVEVAVASAIVYTFGWWFLATALRRDPDGKVLRSFVGSTPALFGIVGALVLLQLLAVGIGGGAALVVLLVGTAGFFALWSRCATGNALSDWVAKGLLLSVTLGMAMGMAEVLFRLPPVVSKTGGNTPGMLRWERKHYDRIWERNRLGIRSLHVAEPKKSDVVRILTIGDSFTWGYMVARTEDVWPYVMECELRDRGRRVEVINLGRNALSTTDEAEILNDVGWLFKPDLIILQYTLNDPLPRSYDNYFRLAPLLPGMNDILDEHSYFFSFLNAKFRALQMMLRYPDGESALFEDGFVGWEQSQAALRAMAEQARSRRTAMMVVLFPLFVPGSMDEISYPFHEAHSKVAAASRAAGVPFFDLLPVYARQGRDGRSWWVGPSESHPSVEAHRLAGQALAHELERLELLPDPATLPRTSVAPGDACDGG
jgi:lysophospholipase L1-like esterase